MCVGRRMVKLVVPRIVLQGIGGRRAKQRTPHARLQVALSDLAVAARANPSVDKVVPVTGLCEQPQPNSDPSNSNQARSYASERDGRHEGSIARAEECWIRRPALESDQNRTRKPNRKYLWSSTRPNGFVAVICINPFRFFTDPSEFVWRFDTFVPEGLAKCGVFVAFIASARIWVLKRSVILKVRNTLISRLVLPGPRS